MDYVISVFGLFAIAFIMSLVTQFSYKYFSDQERIREIKEEINSLRKKMREQTDEKEMLSTQDKILSLTSEKMKIVSKPLVINLVVILLSYNIAGFFFKDFVLLYLPFSFPIIGRDVGWFLTMAIFSMFLTTFVKKKMNIET